MAKFETKVARKISFWPLQYWSWGKGRGSETFWIYLGRLAIRVRR